MGKSTERNVTAHPEEVNVPEVSVLRWNDRLEQLLARAVSERTRTHAQRWCRSMLQTIAPPPVRRKLCVVRTGAMLSTQ